MAKAKKDLEPLGDENAQAKLNSLKNNEPPIGVQISIENIIVPEIEFLEALLNVQNVGHWHGPAAGLIKERLKLLKG